MKFEYIVSDVAPIFYKLLYLSVTAIMLGVFFAVLRKPLDKIISPRWKDFLWLIVMLALVFPFRIKSPISISDALNLRIIENISYNSNEKFKALIIDFALPCIWLAGCFISVLVLVVGRTRLGKIIKHALRKPEDNNLREIVNECCDILGLSSSSVRIAVQDYVKTPAVTGISSPIILLPEYYRDFRRSCLKYIILHELSHYKRGDTRLNLAISLIRAVHWFNPLIYPILKMVREDIELANDSCVLSNLDDEERAEYRNAVFENLRLYVKSSNTANVLCMTDTAGSIKRRIKMLDSVGFFEKRGFLLTALCTVIAVTGIMLFASSTGFETEVAVEINEVSEHSLKYTLTNGTFGKIKTTGEVIIEESVYNPENGMREWQEVKNTVYESEEMLSCPQEEYSFGNGYSSFTIIDWLGTGSFQIKVPYIRNGVKEYACASFEYEGGNMDADSITKSDVFSKPDDGADAYLTGKITSLIRKNRSGNEYTFTDYHTVYSFVYQMKSADWFEGSGCLADNCSMHNNPLFEVEVIGDNPAKFRFYQICGRSADVEVWKNDVKVGIFYTDEESALDIKAFSEKVYRLNDGGSSDWRIHTSVFLTNQSYMFKGLEEAEKKKLAADIREFHKYLEYVILSGIEADIKEPEGIYWDWLINGIPDEYYGAIAWEYDELGNLYKPQKPTLILKLQEFEKDIEIIKNKETLEGLKDAITLLGEGLERRDVEKLFAAHRIIHDYDYFTANYPVSPDEDLWVDSAGINIYFGIADSVDD